MSVTIRCKKTNHSIDLGYFGFMLLRRKVAELQGGPFQAVYEEICSYHPGKGNETVEAFDKRVNARIAEILDAKEADVKIVDFLLQCDAEGRIKYGACKSLLKVIGDYDDNVLYGYAGRHDSAKFADFKRLLQECANHRCDLFWD